MKAIAASSDINLLDVPVRSIYIRFKADNAGGGKQVLHGANQIAVPFGNGGFLCAGGGIVRSVPMVASSGTAGITYDNDVDLDWFVEHLVVSGAYRLESWDREQQVVLDRNPGGGFDAGDVMGGMLGTTQAAAPEESKSEDGESEAKADSDEAPKED